MPRRVLLSLPAVAAAAALATSRWGAAAGFAIAVAVGGAVAAALWRTVRAGRRGRFRADTNTGRLLDHLPLAVLLFDAGGLVYANPAARGLFPGTATGRATLEALGDVALADAVARAGQTLDPVEVDTTRDGRQLAGRASLIGPQEVALVVTDRTEERRVDAMRRDFVLNASHELKTPVAGIQALTESLPLAVDRDPQRARRMIDRLHVEATRLARLVRELLDLARMEDGAAEVTLRRVDVAEVVRAQIDRLADMAAQRGVAVTADGADRAPVVAVPEDIRLIAGNLLENAVAYNREGGRVRVTLRHTDGEVLLEVADTGIGIADADRDRVFERFYRVDQARSRDVGGGTGLGLSLVRHAAARHGGRVSVDSVLGKGSTFRVVLPAADEEA